MIAYLYQILSIQIVIVNTNVENLSITLHEQKLTDDTLNYLTLQELRLTLIF